MYFRSVCLLLISLISLPVAAKSLTLPETDRQQIKFWQPYITSQKNPAAIHAQQVFTRLLTTWDQSRVEPKLVVVKTDDGPWAASLADGHILINLQALGAVKKIEPRYHKDALAFILAHELSHQRKDDLWHQRFFRTNKHSAMKPVIDDVKNRRLKEIQADQDGLTMMTVAGFNPRSIIQGKGFFTAWLEVNRRYDCDKNHQLSVCEFAKQRSKNIKQQIEQIVLQKIWYDLGLFLLANNQFEQSRQYFLTFAKSFPHWIIYNTVAVSYLLESMQNTDEPDFYISLNQLNLDSLNTNIAKRSASIDKEKLLKQAIHYLNKSDHLRPNNPETLYLLSLTYIMSKNLPMAKGILEGKLKKKNKLSGEIVYLRALINEQENNKLEQEKNLKLASTLVNEKNQYLRFAILNRQLKLKAETSSINAALNKFVDKTAKSGDSIGFQWGLNKLKSQKHSLKSNNALQWPTLNGSTEISAGKTLWMLGEPFEHKEKNNFHFLVDQKMKSIFTWCILPDCFEDTRINSKDRLLTAYGFPNRIQHIASADYLIYQDAKFIAKLVNDKIVKLFKIQEPVLANVN